MNVYPVIMCGGSGTRLWPVSRPSRPKQFAPLIGPETLFVQTVRRARKVAGFRRLIVVTGARQAHWARAQIEGADATLLLEPEPRDSAPAMAAAAVWIAERDPEGIGVFLASDHYIPDTEKFCDAVEKASRAAQGGRIVALGVKPTKPSSAYGYIRPARGEAHAEATPVDAFVEKPDFPTAERYVAEGYLWNSGNFIASASTFLKELDRRAPAIAAAARKAVARAKETQAGLKLDPVFAEAPKISIDYALMEKTDRASVLAVDFAWSDVGAWDAVYAACPHDEHGNAVAGEAVTIDARDCLVRAAPGVLVAAAGVRDLAIVAEPDAVLVCHANAAQSVKKIVERLRAEAKPQADAAGDGAGPAQQESARDLRAWAERYRLWLFAEALPLWQALGADYGGWGWHESLSLRAKPTGAPRRARVQARQVYAYAAAGALGWAGPWKAAVEHGLEGFFAYYRRPDGLFRTLVSPDGTPIEETAYLYDQAFALLALAAARAGRPSAEDEALALLAAIEKVMRHEKGGFREAGARPFQSNPHMHLFEACLAWIEAGGGERWTRLAGDIVRLALDRFIDAEGGFLREFFDAGWRPAPGEAGRRVEPGHQFEWAWLLERWSRRTGDREAACAARRLYAAGMRGVDARRGVAVDALDDRLEMLEPRARLWPQTERLKAALILSESAQGDSHEALRADARRAAAALWRYLDVEPSGLWRDKLGADGRFEEEPAPASSFYHLVAAVAQLSATALG
ncbi:AGE family epimerase/isomerase [Amphiplicatus metriothermophilus]|uniref:Mannose-1-phosphate guanylyltransferase/mannose-6-phosphate isomerase n=1 Tax=Amphiplicatus metriothermophilus TaxID=1519374 RepID=A0A239PPZ5_9PROT|nr:AGE family epimerase/isomerase [Amphiplicatus metriothermophilus]MBB5518624.1 mannose-1-phosphate guanylyltransferase/mannose-6-phosphate isomerase [Amphiplicatus metriothermophilus]SNT72218.1 mannose-1-phosphate guanylyltransferase/mannose-6-phosphate isomerase [Amphiplicatus metriothermophilus]